MATPSVMCSWEVAPGDRLVDALSTTPGHVEHAPNSKPVTLHQPSSATSSGCILSLHSDKGDVMGISLVSEARIVELYVNHEYLSTNRGTRSCVAGGEDLMFIIDVQLETSQSSCELKLLSLPKKNTVTINSLVLRMKERDNNTTGVVLKDLCDFRRGTSGLDLRKMEDMVETISLSPKAEKLLMLLQSQQQRGQAQGSSDLSSAASIDSSCVSLLRMLLNRGANPLPHCPFPIPERTGKNMNFGTCEKMIEVHSETENCGYLPASHITSTNVTSSVVDGGRRVDILGVEDDEITFDGNPGGCTRYRCDAQQRCLKVVGSTDGGDCDNQIDGCSAAVPQCLLGSNREENVLAQVQKMTSQLEMIEKRLLHIEGMEGRLTRLEEMFERLTKSSNHQLHSM